MPELDEISYSRDAAVTAVRDNYIFLPKMYLDEVTIMTPAEKGRLNIINAAESHLAGLHKTEEVLALLAHLSYIRGTPARMPTARRFVSCQRKKTGSPARRGRVNGATDFKISHSANGLRIFAEVDVSVKPKFN